MDYHKATRTTITASEKQSQTKETISQLMSMILSKD